MWAPEQYLGIGQILPGEPQDILAGEWFPAEEQADDVELVVPSKAELARESREAGGSGSVR